MMEKRGVTEGEGTQPAEKSGCDKTKPASGTDPMSKMAEAATPKPDPDRNVPTDAPVKK